VASGNHRQDRKNTQRTVENSMSDPVVHFEMPYEDRDRMVRFYEKVFGWKAQKLGPEMGNYVLVTTSETDVKPDAPRGAINGGFWQKRSDWPAQVPAAPAADVIARISGPRSRTPTGSRSRTAAGGVPSFSPEQLDTV
jgi:predicted enzyme related to lactoylglutathione lyase